MHRTHLYLLVVMAMAINARANGLQPPAVEYLSSLPECLALHQQGWGELGINVCAHAAGQPPLKLRIKDTEYTNGLGHHAPGEIVLELDGQYDLFEAEVGVQWQNGSVGSVVFRAFVDGAKRFDSGIMRETDAARPIRLSVAGASELRLVVTDAGDGVTCDCANWANARLTRSTQPPARRMPEPFDIAPFARVVTWDPDRMDGARANRVQEFHAEDLFVETPLLRDPNGAYRIPVADNGRGCIGLQWIERRRLADFGIEFADQPVSPDGVEVQAWVGESNWQGRWLPLKGGVEQRGSSWLLHVDRGSNPDIRDGTRKIRWLFANAREVPSVSRLWANTTTAYSTADVVVQLDQPRGQMAELEVYNGAIVGDSGDALRCAWKTISPLRLKVRYSKPRLWKSDRTVLRLRLPSGSFGVAVDDLIANGCVYVEKAGLFAAHEPAKVTLADYKRRIAGRKTVLERVRDMPDQTFEQSMAKTRNPIQDSGPVMLSLACDNRKFVVTREGSLQFERNPESEEIASRPLQAPCVMMWECGAGAARFQKRFLQGGWLPMPVTVYSEGETTYQQLTCVAPFASDGVERPVCVSRISVSNAGSSAADASVRLSFRADAEKNTSAEVRQEARGASIVGHGRLLAWVEAPSAGPLRLSAEDDGVVLSGTVPAKSHAECSVYIPGWNVRPEDHGLLTGSDRLVASVGPYWEKTLANAARIDVPDPLLANVIKASQVHCLVAARNEEGGARVAPWIASMSYGPLESESNSIVRGMMLMGHDDFARRSLDFFIHRYSPEGFLTTGYTLMGTGWHLWSLGEYVSTYADKDWMTSVAPKVDNVCRWITHQREKTKKLDGRGHKVPEYGLMPPGVQADWNAFSYHFSLNGYYYAGLRHAAEALASIGHPGAKALTDSARELRECILDAYRWTQARMPVLQLKSGAWVPGYPGQLYAPGPTNDFFPGEDANRSWAYDVELGAHQLVPQGVLDPNSPEVDAMMNHMEDVQFLADGWFDYDAERNERDWFNMGGFAKVQPYYCRNAEIYTLRDDVKPFIRSYFNSIASLLNTEVLSFWEHFHASGAWNKTHETGYFLQQTRSMMVMERGEELWLAPFVTSCWMRDGMTVGAANAPTRFGRVSYRIASHTAEGCIEAEVDPPTRSAPSAIVIRLRHPDGKHIRSITVNGSPHTDFDAAREVVRVKPSAEKLTIRAEY